MQRSEEIKRVSWKEKWRLAGLLTSGEAGRQRILTALRGATVFGLCLLLSRAQLPLRVFPLGVAFLCAVEKDAPWAALGFLIAGFSSPYPVWCHAVVAVLVLGLRIGARIFVDVPARLGEKIVVRETFSHLRGRIFCESLYLRMTVACVGAFCMSLYAIIAGGFRYYDLFGAFLSLGVAPVMTAVYSGAFDRKDKLWRQGAAASAVIVSVCLGMVGKTLWGMDLSLMTGFVGTLYARHRHGLVWGCVTAILCGLLCGLYSLPAFLAVVIASFCLSDASPRVGAAAALVGGTVGGLLGGGSFRELFLAFFGGTALYVTGDRIRHSDFFRQTEKKRSTQNILAADRLHAEKLAHEQKRLLALSEAFLGIGSADVCPPERAEKDEGFLAGMEDLYSRIGQHLSDVVEEENEQFKMAKKEMATIKKRLRELGFEAGDVLVTSGRRKTICLWDLSPYPDGRQREYLAEQMGKSLGITLGDLCPSEERADLWVCRRIPQMKVTAGQASAAGEQVCGDETRVFGAGDEGLFFATLCDGMGMGPEAAATARICGDFLEKALRGGLGGELSLRLLNRYLPPAREGEISSSVDVLQFDTFDGKLICYKCGAAPTFVKRGDNLFRLSSVTVPMGILPEIDAGQTTIEGRPGDVYVMVSDGITGGENECPWLLSYLDAATGEDPERMAQEIVEIAGEQGSRDDRSAIVIRID